MVLSAAVKKFPRPSMSQEVSMRADSASRNSLEKDNDLLGAANDQKVDAASLTSSHGTYRPKQKNVSIEPTSVSGLHPDANGNANAEVDKDSSNPLHEASKSSNENEQEENSVDRSDSEDLPAKSVLSNDGEESDPMEQDVKVCDICGDAGREDLLAVCSRCTDGAEHTYCMREMLQKVPEEEWLCEECKFTEESAAQKPGLEFEGKSSGKTIQVLGKRPAEDIEVPCTTKKQALEVNARSPRMGPNVTATPSRSSSFKNMDKGKGRVAHDSCDAPRAPNTSQIQVSKGSLLKSKSFNALTAKSKAKQAEEGFPQKPRGARLHSLSDNKIGSLRTLGKSASFKYVNRRGPDSPDAKVKIHPPKFSSVQELKGGSKEKNGQNPADRNRLLGVEKDRPSASRNSSASSSLKLDQRPLSRSETHSLSSVSDSRDSNSIQSEGKLRSSLSRSASHVARRGTDGTVGSSATGSSSSDGGCDISVKKRLNHVGPKGGILSGKSWSSEKPSNSGAGSIQDGLIRARESRNHLEKAQDSRLGKAVTSGSRALCCEKCGEAGHTAELCSCGSSQAGESDVSAAKSIRGDMNYGSKSTFAVTSAMLKKPGIYRRNKALDKSDTLSVSNTPATQEKSTFSDILKKSENATQLNGLNEATDSSLKAGVSAWKGKPLLENLPALWKASIIPEHEYIWQGGFQVQRGSKQTDLQGGFQAHLSTCVSPMVLEMVTRLPDKIVLNEVPRLSTWPAQFRDYGTKEDHIAIYFFARDVESYERNYRGLLENLMKSDLALKGDLGSVELLIFPSNQLPEKSQRWNMSFYLWGVFKGSRVNGLDCELGEGERPRMKQKMDTGGTRGCSDSGDGSLSRDGFAHQIHDLNDCSAAAENLRSEEHSNGVTMKGLETTERYLFPVGSRDSKGLHFDANSKESNIADSTNPWRPASSLKDRRQGGTSFPDLELALGAETKPPSKGISFWDGQSKPSPKEEDDPSSASLSLSLSFPFPEGERRGVKPFLKEKFLREGTL